MKKYFLNINCLNLFARLALGAVLALLLASNPFLSKTVWATGVEKSRPINIVYSIQPLALIGREMFGTQARHQALLPPGASPHDYALKINDVKTLKQADIIVWMGPVIEPYLEKAFNTISEASSPPQIIDVSEVLETKNIKPHAYTALSSHQHRHHSFDLHIWMSPAYAIAIAENLAQSFNTVTGNQEVYALEKPKAFSKKITALKPAIKDNGEVRISYQPYVVFHDAFSYLEDYLGIKNSGAITDNLHNRPGLQHVLGIAKNIAVAKPVCMLAPLNYDEKLTEKLFSATQIDVIRLDIMAEQESEGMAYTDYLATMIEAIKNCINYQLVGD